MSGDSIHTHLLSDDGGPRVVQLHARSIGDRDEANPNGWYKAHRITEGVKKKLKRQPRLKNMISLNVFYRVINDLGTRRDSRLLWLPGHMKSIFGVKAAHSRVLQGELLARWQTSALTPISAEQVWNKLDLSTEVDNAVRRDCRDVFNGIKTERLVCNVAALILARLSALKVDRYEGGVRVASIPRPDQRKPNNVQNVRRTYHNRCSNGCKGIQEDWCSSAEVDMVGHDTVTNTTVLFELKTRDSDVLDDRTLARYNCQLWLTWMMFSLTYPSIAERTLGYLIIVRPGANHVTILNCYRPTITKALRERYPWITCFCPQVFRCLTPSCVNKRVMRRGRRPSNTDHRDLSYRNYLINICHGTRTVGGPASTGRLEGRTGTGELQPPAAERSDPNQVRTRMSTVHGAGEDAHTPSAPDCTR